MAMVLPVHDDRIVELGPSRGEERLGYVPGYVLYLFDIPRVCRVPRVGDFVFFDGRKKKYGVINTVELAQAPV